MNFPGVSRGSTSDRPPRTPAPESRSPTPNLNRPARQQRSATEVPPDFQKEEPLTKRKKIIETSESEEEEIPEHQPGLLSLLCRL
uniref:WH2 domain-containing protein n=1 Tax=Steinernema glaseri TaxID=37863 RepID=A0A1I8AV99_9BILA